MAEDAEKSPRTDASAAAGSEQFEQHETSPGKNDRNLEAMDTLQGILKELQEESGEETVLTSAFLEAVEGQKEALAPFFPHLEGCPNRTFEQISKVAGRSGERLKWSIFSHHLLKELECGGELLARARNMQKLRRPEYDLNGKVITEFAQRPQKKWTDDQAWGDGQEGIGERKVVQPIDVEIFRFRPSMREVQGLVRRTVLPGEEVTFRGTDGQEPKGYAEDPKAYPSFGTRVKLQLEKDMQECTFHPKITKYAVPAGPKRFLRRGDTPDDVRRIIQATKE